MYQVKATVSLNVEGDRLVYAGLGYQPSADFPQGSIVGEPQLPASDRYLEVKTKSGKVYRVRHENVQEVF